jgi:putative membrane protein
MKMLALAVACLAVPALAYAESPKPAAATLSDGNIVAIAATAHQGEIDAAKLALQKTTNKDVRTFADQMVLEHTAALEKVNALGLAAEENEDSKTLKADAAATATKLGSLTGADFDRAYVDAQVTDHKKVLEAIDKKLMPSAKNAGLKKVLKETRPTVAKHLKHAEQLQKKMTAPASSY